MQLLIDNYIYLLVLAVIILIIMFIHLFSLRHTRRRAMSFANFDAIEKVMGKEIISKNMTLLYLRVAILFFIFVSLSGPSLIYPGLITDSDFVLTIDASASMMANDMQPNRLAVAKETAIDFINTLQGGQSKVGVVTFSGASYIERLPTDDMTLVKGTIAAITKKDVGGTDIGNALLTSINLLRNSDKGKTIILITDGQVNTGNVNDALQYAHDISIYAIGMGTAEGGEFAGDAISKIDDKTLQIITNYTNGRYYQASSKEELKKAYAEIGNLKQGARKLNLTAFTLIIAILLIILDWILINTRYRTLP
jgi:Ca-activated chloride channel family protein